MDAYLSDKEQVEMIKEWWKHYGKWILAAIILGLGLGLSWQTYHHHQIERSEAASILYEQLQIALQQHQFDAVSHFADELQQKYPRTSYASLAALLSAKQSVDKNDFNAALQSLQWVVQKGKMPALRQMARLRVARIELSMKQYSSALAMLQKIDDPGYAAAIADLQGDVYQAQGDLANAHQAYQTSKDELVKQGGESPIIDMKLSEMQNF